MLAVRFAPEALKVCEAEAVPNVVLKPERVDGVAMIEGEGAGILKVPEVIPVSGLEVNVMVAPVTEEAPLR